MITLLLEHTRELYNENHYNVHGRSKNGRVKRLPFTITVINRKFDGELYYVVSEYGFFDPQEFTSIKDTLKFIQTQLDTHG